MHCAGQGRAKAKNAGVVQDGAGQRGGLGGVEVGFRLVRDISVRMARGEDMQRCVDCWKWKERKLAGRSEMVCSQQRGLEIEGSAKHKRANRPVGPDEDGVFAFAWWWACRTVRARAGRSGQAHVHHFCMLFFWLHVGEQLAAHRRR